MRPEYPAAPLDDGRLVVQIARSAPAHIAEALIRARSSNEIIEAEAEPIWHLPNLVGRSASTVDQWYLDAIGAPQAWATSTGEGVVVAVLDSGVDYNHPDLEQAVWINEDEIPDNGIDDDLNGYIDDFRGWNFVDNNADPQDTTGHGTHVAGIIGARGSSGTGIVGVAPGVRLMIVRTGSSDGQVASSTAAAIRYAVDNGADIINMSYGGFDSYAGLREAIDYAIANDVLLIAAAHNHADSAHIYPAIEQEVIAVASLGADNRRSAFSNYGRWVDIAAPGEDILSTNRNGGIESLEGTSQASPIVAGVAALALSAHPDFTVRQLRKQVLATAVSVGEHNPDDLGLIGAGRVDAAGAVGPAVTDIRAYLAGVHASELDGNGDQQIGAGESATLTVSLHVTSASGLVQARLSSQDPWVTVSSSSAELQTRDDRTVAGTFSVQIDPNVPQDHVASLRLAITDGPTLALSLPVAPRWRRIETLPFACSQNLLSRPDGTEMLITDMKRRRVDSTALAGGPSCPATTDGYVYASIRNTDGSFTEPRVLSDPAVAAECPAAVMGSNGDIHVAFHDEVRTTSGCNEVFSPGYIRFDSAAGQWDTQETILDGGITEIGAHNKRSISIATDASGAVHIAWTDYNTLRAAVKAPSGDWTLQLIQPFSDPGTGFLLPKLINADGILRLFVREIDSSAVVSVLQYDEATSTWSAPIQTFGVTTGERATLPFVVGDDVYRAYSPTPGDSLGIAQLLGTYWNSVTTLDVGTDGIIEFTAASLDDTGASFASMVSRGIPDSLGSELALFTTGDVATNALIPNNRKLQAVAPEIGVDADGHVHVAYGQTLKGWPKSSAYTTDAPISPAALPGVPVVVDDGEITTDNRILHAQWSSSNTTPGTTYRIAWGTQPGADDIAPWQDVLGTHATIDLGSRRVLPGQTVYASVQARSEAILTSAPGVSDGITFVPLGDANGDGRVAMTDALAVARKAAGLNPVPFYPEAADVNCDGAINIVDAQLIAIYCDGRIDHFPCQ